MRKPERPHFLLFSATEPQAEGSRGPDAGGRWRFQLESLDGSATFGAADREPAMDAARLELLAVVRGLEALDGPCRVTLVTPSRYVRRGIRFGLRGWRESDWCWEAFGRMQRVPNADLWRRIDTALTIHDVRCRAWQFAAAPAKTPLLTAGSTARHGQRHRGIGSLMALWKGIYHRWSTRRTMLCPQ